MNVHGFHLGKDVTNEKKFIDEIIILIHTIILESS